jgi:tetratricopeptide (TPR) repeat protein
MKILFSVLVFTLCIPAGFSQETAKAGNEIKFDKQQFLKELSDNACKCIDSVSTYNKAIDSINIEINSCIDKQVGAYQLGTKIAGLKDLQDTTKNVNLSIDVNSDSKEYKEYYYEMERYLVANCTAIKNKIAVNDKGGASSYSNNVDALKYYNLGLDESKKNNFKKAIEYYEKAIVFDPGFAFAYDNMGICYRRLNEFDKAIDAYQKSLKIDPTGTMPLQNIAIAYSYKKDYKKAVKAFEKLAKVDAENPEVFYGIGQLYAQHLFDYEKALENLCQAYNIYVAQKSPYRTDAENLIQIVFTEMRKEGKEATFNAILKKHNIDPN